MRYGVNLPPFGDFSEPGALAELAHEAEPAGWDGFFIWDHMVFDPSWHPMADPWVGLASATGFENRGILKETPGAISGSGSAPKPTSAARSARAGRSALPRGRACDAELGHLGLQRRPFHPEAGRRS